MKSRPGALRQVVRYIAVILLLAIVFFEGYYIFMLRNRINSQTDELRRISVQLQLLKSERDSLNEEVSSAKKQAGERNDRNTVQR